MEQKTGRENQDFKKEAKLGQGIRELKRGGGGGGWGRAEWLEHPYKLWLIIINILKHIGIMSRTHGKESNP